VSSPVNPFCIFPAQAFAYYNDTLYTVKHSGNLPFDDILRIAKTMRPRSMAKNMTGTVKEILGTCVSVGCTVDGQTPKDIQEKIDSGEIIVED